MQVASEGACTNAEVLEAILASRSASRDRKLHEAKHLRVTPPLDTVLPEEIGIADMHEDLVRYFERTLGDMAAGEVTEDAAASGKCDVTRRFLVRAKQLGVQPKACLQLANFPPSSDSQLCAFLGGEDKVPESGTEAHTQLWEAINILRGDDVIEALQPPPKDIGE